jgi:hypothetical protein
MLRIAATLAVTAVLGVFGATGVADAAQINVVQDTDPNSTQAFGYTAGGGLTPGAFVLDDDGLAANGISNRRSFTNLAAGSGYSIAQNSPTPPGYESPQVSCSDGSSPSNITLSSSETVTCTFYNRLTDAGTLTVVKDAVPEDPNVDFLVSVSGPTPPGSATLRLNGSTFQSRNRASFAVNPGTYQLSEAATAGWVQQSATCSDGSPISGVDVGANENVTCTFVNHRLGKIRAVLLTQPQRDPQDFDMTAGGGLSPASFQLDDDPFDATLSNVMTFQDLTPGSGYSLAESVPAGWVLAGSSCDDGSPRTNIDVSVGETVSCYFTNNPTDLGSITLRKEAQPESGQAFKFTSTSPYVSFPEPFGLVDDGPGGNPNEETLSVRAGTYSFGEDMPAVWKQAWAGCDDGSPVTAVQLSAGEHITCTFLNYREGTYLGYARPKAATPFLAALVPAYQPCSDPDRVHGGSLSFGSCSVPSQSSGHLEVGTPDANGAGARSTGMLRLATRNVGTPAVDVSVDLSITDVRCRPVANTVCGAPNAAGGADYAGSLGMRAQLRMTDKLNDDGDFGEPSGTAVDAILAAPVACGATVATTDGALCTTATTVSALAPGAVVGGARSIWELGRIEVDDGGADGDAGTTGDNSIFEVQGLFVP